MWLIGLVANGIIAVAFLAVAGLLGKNLAAQKSWRTNPLGTGTFLLYVTCGGGHAVHFLQLLLPSLGVAGASLEAARLEYVEWHAWTIDIATAFAGVWYWTMRRKFPDLVSGAAVYEDLRERQRRAIEINDNVVQGLARAKLALDIRAEQESGEAIEETLERSKRIISDLLVEQQGEGGLRRSEAAPGGE